eukprot:TRINITY_DN928_c0_g1_i3.p1 TRINITY_DN928_c0_g1~~TRINITY_DN928_c0_g1_i3.p1  ORF type:complete len:181 (-),score=19.61 TRINITY_DN928_c0_g1_i3:605-1147(-)
MFLIDIYGFLNNSTRENIDNFTWEDNKFWPTKIQLPIISCIGYLVVIFAFSALKLKLNASLLKFLLAIHNLFLFLFSVLMLVETVSSAFNYYQADASLYDLYCDPKIKYNSGRLHFWVFVFHFSKYYELIDTLFVCLKGVSFLFFLFYLQSYYDYDYYCYDYDYYCYDYYDYYDYYYSII